MSGNRQKKRQRSAKARNEAIKKVALIEASAAAPKKRGGKEELMAQAEALGKPAKWIEARQAEFEKKYVLWSKREVVEFTGEIRRKTSGMYGESVQGDQIEYMFKTWGMSGDETQPFGYAPYYPLRDDTTEAARIMERFHYKLALLERRMGVKSEARKAKAEVPQEIDETTGEPIPRPVKKAGKPRGDMDEKTGVTVGSDGHTFGLIMLATPAGDEHRRTSIMKIVEVLKSRMDEKKAKGLAASWVSTLIRKRPDIYGKLQTAKA